MTRKDSVCEVPITNAVPSWASRAHGETVSCFPGKVYDMLLVAILPTEVASKALIDPSDAVN